MNVELDSAEAKQRLDRFTQACRSAGVILTHQRLEIFREVALTTAHPDAITVYNGVRRRLPSISLDTVYRALSTMVDLGVLGTLGSPHERVRFDANTRPHHHFVCTRCGLMHDFHNDDLDRLGDVGAIEGLGRIESAHVELRGTCQACAKRAGWT